jgi:hypothetical protein
MAQYELREMRRVMGVLERMKPKPHEDMKVGSKKRTKVPKKAKKKA